MQERHGFVFGGSAVVHPWIAVTPFQVAPRPSGRTEEHGRLASYLHARFPGRLVEITESGRAALGRVLQTIGLGPTDCVTIATTSGNHYVSGCVTQAIERVARWSRAREPATRAVLVIHEFGYPLDDLAPFREWGVPIIEDCAYAFASRTAHGDVGSQGDYALFSFPKFFPVQCGGALIGSAVAPSLEGARLSPVQRYVDDVVGMHVPDIQEICARRHANAARLAALLAPLGCRPYWGTSVDHVPGTFMLVPPPGVDLPSLKQSLHAAGVECSVFYGTHAFFVPVHQALHESHLRYIVGAIDVALGHAPAS